MNAALIVVLVQLVAQYGPEVVNELISVFKSDTCPTTDQINALHAILKDPKSYFPANPPAA
jgi:hypothetical protein